MTENFNSWNVWITQKEALNKGPKVKSLIWKIALSVLLIVTLQWTAYNQLWVPEAFSMGWQTKIESTNQDKFEIKEGISSYEDEFVTVKKQWKILVINFKMIPDIQTIIMKSGFLEYVKKCYIDLDKNGALKISQDWDNKIFEIIRPWSFTGIVEKTTQEFLMNTQRSVYIILLQNYLRSLKFKNKFESSLIFPEYYDNKKRGRKDQEVVFLRQEGWRQIAIRFYAEGDKVIPLEAKDFNLDDSWWRKTREEYSRIIETVSLWIMKEVFWVTSDKIIVQTWSSNRTTLKKALKEWFTVLFLHFSPESFKNNALKAVVGGPRELDKRTFDILLKAGIQYIRINYLH